MDGGDRGGGFQRRWRSRGGGGDYSDVGIGDSDVGVVDNVVFRDICISETNRKRRRRRKKIRRRRNRKGAR